MANKIILASIIALFLTFSAIAQDTAKPTVNPEATTAPAAIMAPTPTPTAAPATAAADPLISYAFTQAVSADSYNGIMAPSNIYNGYKNTFVSRTNFKYQVDFDLGSGVKLAPWIQERVDILDDPTTTAGKIGANFRNRFYAGLNFYLPIDKAFNIGVNAEYRYATYLKTATPTAAQIMVTQNRLTEFLIFSGKIEGLYYTLSTDLPFYFSDNSKGSGIDSSMLEFEGNYTLGYGFILDKKTTLKVEALEYIDAYNILGNANVSIYPANLTDTVLGSPAFASELRARLILATAGGNIAPFVGFLKSTQLIYLTSSSSISTISDIVGVTFGADLKVGSNSTFNLTADIGVDAASGQTPQPIATEVSASITIKG